MKNRRLIKMKDKKESRIIQKNKRVTCITVEPVEDRRDYLIGFDDYKRN